MAALLALPFVFYVSNSKEVRDHNVLDRGVLFVSAPAQWLVVHSLDAAADYWQRYVALWGVVADNEQLHADNARLRGAVVDAEEHRQENDRLRLLLGLQARAPAVKMVFAQVIGTSPTPLFRSLRIDRGSRDGLHLGAAVVGDDGVIGRVAALGSHDADIMLLVDNNSSTDVLVQRTRARGRVRGQGGDHAVGIEVQYLARTAGVEPGDVLITSGLGKTFPKGLRVGKVLFVERRAFGLYQCATVQPSVDFSRIEAVMVLLHGYPAEATFETPEARDFSAGGPWREATQNAEVDPDTASEANTKAALDPALEVPAASPNGELPL